MDFFMHLSSASLIFFFMEKEVRELLSALCLDWKKSMCTEAQARQVFTPRFWFLTNRSDKLCYQLLQEELAKSFLGQDRDQAAWPVFWCLIAALFKSYLNLQGHMGLQLSSICWWQLCSSAQTSQWTLVEMCTCSPVGWERKRTRRKSVGTGSI